VKAPLCFKLTLNFAGTAKFAVTERGADIATV
jgi:hypothetical protein